MVTAVFLILAGKHLSFCDGYPVLHCFRDVFMRRTKFPLLLVCAGFWTVTDVELSQVFFFLCS